MTGADGPAAAGHRRVRLVLRTRDGLLFDPSAGRTVTPEELADDVRRGHRFQARDSEHGTDCTYRVLVQILLTALTPAEPGTGTGTGSGTGTTGTGTTGRER
ncbi:polyhydroxyalkanoate synthesis regulator DNA-binding domain-containing protein [Streptomyces sp. NPDC051662]|uniref:polyhydroxyalkanoate synthesis regulator DNA-binding domain-containing protein n=1 Tax=Streptomyces sp. NPDC051662 TaxID=3154750 RepID=UPI00343B4FBF